MTQAIQQQTIALVGQIFDQQMPFHQFLGLRVKRYDLSGVEVELAMKPELVGNFHHNILHGGVTATILDVVGGLTAFAGLVASRDNWQSEQLEQRLKALSTIDLRVDYLRPGKGVCFTGTGEVIRSGNRISVCKMELHNEKNHQIALGTATYVVG